MSLIYLTSVICLVFSQEVGIYFFSIFIFRVLFPNSFGRVEQLRPCLPSSVEFSAAEVVEYLIDVVSKRLKELIKKYPSKKVVLAGWGTSCFINHEVV